MAVDGTSGARTAPLPGIVRALILVALATVPLSLGAQPVPALKLKPADAKLDEEFTQITSVRELSDGRVLITDPREGRVIVADFTAGTVEPVGRRGQGPGEFGNVAPIYALNGDSSIMFDQYTRRWHLMAGAKFVSVLPADAPLIVATGGAASGADRLGFVWAIDPKAAKSGRGDYRPGDSSVVVRGSRETGTVDTIVRLRAAATRITAKAGAKGDATSLWVARSAYAVAEEAILFNDGWFAITRLDPYRVDWRSPEGRMFKGAALPVRVIRFDARERAAFERRNAKAIEEMRHKVRDPDVLRDLMRVYTDLPTVYPPYVQGALVASPDGRVLVRRPLTVDFPDWRYDVVDRRGQLVGLLMMGKGERIVGFGEKSAYLVTTDDDDVERIQRHPWP